MTRVVLREGETFQSLLHRFQRKVGRDQILSECRRRRYFESNATKRRRRNARTKNKSARREARMRDDPRIETAAYTPIGGIH